VADGVTVGEAARLVGATVRTLHHWDATGVVTPSARTAGGYRLYTPADVARLRRALLYRDLGVPLARVAVLLDAPTTQVRDELVRRRADVDARLARLRETAATVDRLLAATDSGLLLDPDEQAEVLGPGWDPAWVAQARARWGESVQWTQYAERAARMSADDWRHVAADAHTLTQDLAAARRAGVAPGSAEADALAERHREAMGLYFHCTPAMHVLLARMLADEPGYAQHLDAVEPGLATWLRDVVEAAARARGVDPDTATWE